MPALLIKLALAPGLMIAATLAARRWGARAGGIVAAFPAIVGPLLLVTELEHGARAACHVAGGTLLGLVGLAGFAVAYARTARRRQWAASLTAGWLCAALVSGVAGLLAQRLSPLAEGVIAVAALTAAAAVLGRTAAPRRVPGGQQRLLPRAALTAILVILLAAAVTRLGATAGGMLAALPVLASLLAVFTHREAGAAAATEILRGTLFGMAGFVAFCELVALMIVPDGAVFAFIAATCAALLLQGIAAAAYPPARNSGGRSGEASASACFNPSASRSAA